MTTSIFEMFEHFEIFEMFEMFEKKNHFDFLLLLSFCVLILIYIFSKVENQEFYFICPIDSNSTQS